MQMDKHDKGSWRQNNEIEEFKKQILSHPGLISKWMNINDLCEYHPDKPSKNTVYAWVAKRKIPFHKPAGAKKLRFLREEVDQWLLKGNIDTPDPTDLLSGNLHNRIVR